MGFQEILFWAEGVVDPNEIFQLVSAFVRVKHQKHEQQQAFTFVQFKKKVIQSPYLCKSIEEIYLFSEFGKVYNL